MKKIIMCVMVLMSMGVHAMFKDVNFMVRPEFLRMKEVYTFEEITYVHTGHVLAGTQFERYIFVELESLLPDRKPVTRQLQWKEGKWQEYDVTVVELRNN